MLNLTSRAPLNSNIGNRILTEGAFCDFDDHRSCLKCLMNTTDPEIKFNSKGECSYCESSSKWDFVRVNEAMDIEKIQSLINRIKSNSGESEYDCIIGISGGVDSSYLASLAVEWGLKPLFVHVDAGWNSNIANQNINNLLDSLNSELITEVVDWNIVRGSQLAFLKSGLANQDVPQDYLFTKHVLKVAKKFKIKSILSGSNMATESILPSQWGYDAQDPVHLKAVQKKFMANSQQGIPVEGLLKTQFNQRVNSISVYRPLNFVPYSRNKALIELKKNSGWLDYGPKHFESRWTRYFQGYFLPYRFGYDKRIAHLSSRIQSKELTKMEALNEWENSQYNFEMLKEDEIFISNKLEIEHKEFELYKKIPLSHYTDYPNAEKIKHTLRAMKRLFENT